MSESIYYAVYLKSSGDLFSTGSILADPMPEHLAYRELTETEVEQLQTGWAWNPKTLQIDEPATE